MFLIIKTHRSIHVYTSYINLYQCLHYIHKPHKQICTRTTYMSIAQVLHNLKVAKSIQIEQIIPNIVPYIDNQASINNELTLGGLNG